MIGIGVVHIALNAIKKRTLYKMSIEYIAFMLASSIMLVLPLLPYVSVGYGMTRVYMQMLVVLSPAFIVGSRTFAKYLKISPDIIVLVVLGLLFVCGKGVVYNLFGEPSAISLDSNGALYKYEYVHDEEILAAQWLFYNKNKESEVFGDSFAPWRICPFIFPYDAGCAKILLKKDIPKLISSNSHYYLYLRHQNVIFDEIVFFEKYQLNNTENIKNYFYLFYNKNKIYNNGGSEIYDSTQINND